MSINLDKETLDKIFDMPEDVSESYGDKKSMGIPIDQAIKEMQDILPKGEELIRVVCKNTKKDDENMNNTNICSDETIVNQPPIIDDIPSYDAVIEGTSSVDTNEVGSKVSDVDIDISTFACDSIPVSDSSESNGNSIDIASSGEANVDSVETTATDKIDFGNYSSPSELDPNVMDNNSIGDVYCNEPQKVEQVNNIGFSNTTSLIKDGKIQWILSCPDPKWNEFYNMKSNVIDVIFNSCEPLECDNFLNDIKNASAAIKNSWDLRDVHSQMVIIQNWRDRIREIHVMCNSHYFMVSRNVSFLRGTIDRIEHNIKPASARESLYFLHLRDLELYCTKLESVLRSAEIGMKTLDGAYNVLSRQIAIMAPQRDAEDAMKRIDNYHNNKDKSNYSVEESYNRNNADENIKKSSVSNINTSTYDSINDAVDVKSDISPTGEVNWY